MEKPEKKIYRSKIIYNNNKIIILVIIINKYQKIYMNKFQKVYRKIIICKWLDKALFILQPQGKKLFYKIVRYNNNYFNNNKI
jgi:hypothetical protein